MFKSIGPNAYRWEEAMRRERQEYERQEQRNPRLATKRRNLARRYGIPRNPWIAK